MYLAKSNETKEWSKGNEMSKSGEKENTPRFYCKLFISNKSLQNHL